jgi:hypothetical protein
MRIQRQLAIAAALLVCASGTAAAQEAGKVGLTMGFPAAIGIQWHVSDKVAIRPEISFSATSSEITSGTGLQSEGDSWTVGTNITALFYLSTDDRLRTYLAPRFTWSHASSTSELSLPINNPITGGTTSESTTTGKAYGFGGSFGAQYGLGDRFVVFGELGLNYAHGTNESSLSTVKSTSNGWGTRAAVGIVYFP